MQTHDDIRSLPFKSAGLYQCLNNPLHSDLIFKVGDRQFFAHKCILAARSPYFMETLKKNSNSNEMLNYIYTDKVKAPDEFHEIHQVLNLARTYGLRGLEVKLSHRSLKNINSKINSTTIWDDIGQIANSKLFSDISFIVADSGREFYGHKAIISCQSSYFYSLVRWNWKESNQNSVVVKDIKAQQFDTIFQFLYTNKLNIETAAEALEYHKLAEFFDMADTLGQQCQDIMAEAALDSESVCQLWNFAQDNEMDTLKENCRIFFIKNFLKCSASSGYLDLYYDLLMSVLNSGEIDADVNKMFQAVRLWVDANWQKVEMNPEELYNALLPPHTFFNQAIKMAIMQGRGFTSLFDFFMTA